MAKMLVERGAHSLKYSNLDSDFLAGFRLLFFRPCLYPRWRVVFPVSRLELQVSFFARSSPKSVGNLLQKIFLSLDPRESSMTPELLVHFSSSSAVVMDPISFGAPKHHISRYTNFHATRSGGSQPKKGQNIQLETRRRKKRPSIAQVSFPAIFSSSPSSSILTNCDRKLESHLRRKQVSRWLRKGHFICRSPFQPIGLNLDS